MIYRQLGQSGIEISALGLGTWAHGGTFWGGTDEQASLAAIQQALDLGITLLDTAPAYGYGLAEEVVGRAIRGRDRSRIVLATKVGLAWHEPEGEYFFTAEGVEVYRNLHPANIRRELELSLQRLGTDYVDLYQTHWQDPTTPIAESMGELLKLQAEGKIRAIGVSNCTPEQMTEYLAGGRIDSSQPRYNMRDRAIEADLLPFCREQQIAVLSYSSLDKGLLTGGLDPERVYPEGDMRGHDESFQPAKVRQVNEVLAKLAPYREQYGLDQTQLTIAWTISQPGLTCALVGARNAAQAAGIAPGGGVEIAPADLAAMESIIGELNAGTS